MEKIKLIDIIKNVNGVTDNIISDDIYINKISTDTRENIKNGLYIALQGETFDGHDFVNEAIDKGAVGVIVHKDININFPNIIRVENTKQALQDISSYYRMLIDVKIVGVTGSVGKTTTKDMIASVLGKKYKVLKTSENLNNEIGVSKTILELDNTYDVGVVEMGMCGFGEISELVNIIKPNLGVVTNIGVSHIEKLGSRENIFKAKMEIVNGMQNESILVLNGDDKFLSTYKNDDYNIRMYSVKSENSDVKAANITFDILTTKFNIIDKSKILDVEIPCIGMHNVYNALASYIVAREFGLNDDEIIEGFKLYKPSGMRQKMSKFNGVNFIEDCYNASPDSMKSAMLTLSNIKCKGRKYAIISDMLELGNISEKEHYDVGKLIGSINIDKLYCVGDMVKKCVLGAIESGMSEQSAVLFDTKEHLSIAIKKEIKKDDIVWFKASRGMKLEEVIKRIYEDVERLQNE